MAEIYKSELMAAKSANINDLKNDSQDAQTMINVINSYIAEATASGKLNGQAWNLTFQTLGTFVEALELRKTVATELADGIVPPLDKLITFMGDYNYLNSDHATEVTAGIETCRATITRLENYINEKVQDENEKWVPKYSADQRSNWQNKINENKADIEELEKLLKLLQELDGKYNEALGSLQTVFAGVTKFETKTNEVKPNAVIGGSTAGA